jgi:hypothetical protein
MAAKQRCKSQLRRQPEAEHRVGHGRGHRGGHQGVALDVGVSVEDLAGEHRSGQRSPEDGTDAGSHTGREHDPAVPSREFEQPAEEGAEAGPDLGDRPFATGRSAGAQGNRRRDRLDDRDPAADLAPLVMEGVNRRVGAVAFGLGSEAVDQQAGGQAADGHHGHEQPGPELTRHRLEDRSFSDRLTAVQMGDPAEGGMLDNLADKKEGDSAQPRHDPDHRREHEPLARGPEFEVADCREQIVHAEAAGQTGQQTPTD